MQLIWRKLFRLLIKQKMKQNKLSTKELTSLKKKQTKENKKYMKKQRTLKQGTLQCLKEIRLPARKSIIRLWQSWNMNMKNTNLIKKLKNWEKSIKSNKSKIKAIHSNKGVYGYLLFIHLFIFMFPVDGFSSKIPSLENLEPWHGQSHECSALFHFNAQPKCGQRFVDGVTRFTVASKAFTASWCVIMLRDGLKTSAQSGYYPTTISLKSIAAT